MLGAGLLMAWLHLPLGWLLVIWGAWQLRGRAPALDWAIVAACLGIVAAVGGGDPVGPWDVVAAHGVFIVADVAVCTGVLQLFSPYSEFGSTASRLRLVLPAASLMTVLVWWPTHGELNGSGTWGIVMLVTNVTFILVSLFLLRLLYVAGAEPQAQRRFPSSPLTAE